MIKLIALFLFFAVTAYNTLRDFNVITLDVLLGISALVLAVIYFLELIGHPVDSFRRNQA